jgi:hypothetical protein
LIKKNGIGEYVIIEAFSVDDAVERAERIGLYFDGVYKGYDCECCGDRWYVPYGGGNDEPLIYSKSPEELQSEKWYSVKNIIIHYINGIVKCYAGKLD